MGKIFKIDEKNLKPKRGMSPVISGVNRAPRILLIPGDCSSGIRAYEGGR